MKASKEVKSWEGSRGESEFRLFYVSGELLSLLNDLADEREQGDLLYELVKQEHDKRFGGRDD